MTSPGLAVFALLARYIDAKVLQSVVAPTIADLQFEVETTRNPWRRQLARVRGYAAIGRLLFWHGLIWRSPMRTLLTWQCWPRRGHSLSKWSPSRRWDPRKLVRSFHGGPGAIGIRWSSA